MCRMTLTNWSELQQEKTTNRISNARSRGNRLKSSTWAKNRNRQNRNRGSKSTKSDLSLRNVRIDSKSTRNRLEIDHKESVNCCLNCWAQALWKGKTAFLRHSPLLCFLDTPWPQSDNPTSHMARRLVTNPKESKTLFDTVWFWSDHWVIHLFPLSALFSSSPISPLVLSGHVWSCLVVSIL